MLPKNVHANKMAAFGETLQDTDLRNLGTKIVAPQRYREEALEKLLADAAFLEARAAQSTSQPHSLPNQNLHAKGNGLMDYSLLLGIHNKRLDLSLGDDSSGPPKEERIEPPCIHLVGEEQVVLYTCIPNPNPNSAGGLVHRHP